MKESDLTLYLEINNLNLIFFVLKKNENNLIEIIDELNLPVSGFEDNKISSFEKLYNIIKENIYLIEQKFDYTFKEVVLILENFNPTFINLSGYKNLNGSQISRENIIYILNSLKSYVDKNESKKTILHIFNSNFFLDNKKVINLPIGLFGDFYSHELSFSLISSNDYKNLENIFSHCNLKIKKIFLKSFIKGANISDNNNNKETFLNIKINSNDSKIFYFENDSLKHEQCFNFGSEIILKDISKITSLKIDNINTILENTNLNEEILENELIEEKFFKHNNYRKIKKRLIYEIVLARIIEISEILIFKNINLKSISKKPNIIFLEIEHKLQFESLKGIYRKVFSANNSFEVKFLDKLNNDSLLQTANNLLHYGWKKEAIPVSQVKKSILARFFNTIFN